MPVEVYPMTRSLFASRHSELQMGSNMANDDNSVIHRIMKSAERPKLSLTSVHFASREDVRRQRYFLQSS
ncbi:hypothetical protein Ae201684_009457 [Aphanomyces euteiches]|uniref:Uncharacterized protein n=1 Tax=Aphanomyces euteiches TaxID=100861 RepID=A0A6G0X1Y4_9STRA|nr:hypothetical protein Ae201684_009457 [Aphanomyces euteiches]